MGCITHQRHILKRDGTSQSDRLPEAFDPAYARIDERSADELLQLLKDFSELVQYYDHSNQLNGDWKDFFMDFNKTHEPHIALMLTFLKLFKEARDHLNTLTKRHLDFYYKRYLQIKQLEAVPDRVHLVLELAKNVKEYKLAKNTAFTAGKDQTGKELIYKSEREIVLNKASISQIKSVFVDKKHEFTVYKAEAANSADGKGKEFEGESAAWYPFGKAQMGLSSGEQNMEKADIGFAIASSTFRMKEGTRKVKLTIALAELPAESGIKLNDLLKRDLSESFTGYFSGEEEWLGPFEAGLAYDSTKQKLALEFTVDKAQKSVVNFNDEVLRGNFDNNKPVLKVLLNKDNPKHPYLWARSLRYKSIEVDASVEGLQSLILHNELGKIDHEKPFMPFGKAPQKGDSFYIGSDEVFAKDPDTLKLRYKWKDLPESYGGFPYYYQYYKSSYKNEDFKLRLSALSNADWKPDSNAEEIKMFETTIPETEKYTSGKEGKSKSSGGGSGVPYYYFFQWPVLKKDEISREIDVSRLKLVKSNVLSDLTKYSPEVKNGFMKLELIGQDFGHKEYPPVYSRQAVIVSKTLQDNPAATYPTLPNEPYTPELEYLKLDYGCSETIGFDDTGSTYAPKLMHVNAFGEEEILSGSGQESVNLVPVYAGEGNMYIGVRYLSPPQNLSILFRVAEDSADPDKISESTQLSWSYLTEQGWKSFSSKEIISETTNSFLSSGIVILSFPEEAVEENTMMPKSMHWIKVSCHGNVEGVNKMVHLKAQAITAVFEDNENDPAHYADALEKESISKLKNQDHNIKKVSQPFASFGGRQPEKDLDYPVSFYARVSERLRHKNRAVTYWDYERLVLEQFPNIYKVKSLNHSSEKNDIAPGNVSIVLIEQIRNENAVNPLQPRTSRVTLTKVRDFLKNHVSPFVKIHVQNPIYEQVKVSFKVAFKSAYDPGYYQNVLNEDIKKFLSPWAYEEGKDIIFGNAIYKSSIYHYVEKREYVDFLMDFKMSHIKPNWGIGCMEVEEDFYVGEEEVDIDVDRAEAKTSRSILVSAGEHDIDLITDASIICSGS